MFVDLLLTNAEEYLLSLIRDKDDLLPRIKRIFAYSGEPFTDFLVHAVPADSALESLVMFKPTKLFGELTTAIETKNWDKIAVIERHVFSLPARNGEEWRVTREDRLINIQPIIDTLVSISRSNIDDSPRSTIH